MKRSKRIAALLLAVCLLAGMAVPMVSADSGSATKTVTYDFDYNTIRQEAGITTANNGVFDSIVQGYINNTLYGNYINWKCYGKKQMSTLTSLFNNTANGHLEFRAAEKDWIAFDIDNPGAGQWNLSFVGYESRSSAREVNVYIIKKTTDDEDVSAGMTEKNLVETLSFTSDSKTEVSTERNFANHYTFEENGKYIVALEAKTKTTATDGYKDRAWICLKELKMTKSCTDVAAEINNAILGSTISLQSKVTTGETLALKNGVTLDLNGQTLNAANLNSVKGSEIMDSSENDTGILNVSGTFGIASTNKELPLKDGEGYRFFTFTLTSQDATDYNAENGSAKFWFSLTFDNTDAYDLISGGETGLKIYARLGWTGLSGGKYVTPQPEFYSQWASAAKANSKVSINLTVIGIHKVSGFTLMPNVRANGVDLMQSAITYTAA